MTAMSSFFYELPIKWFLRAFVERTSVTAFIEKKKKRKRKEKVFIERTSVTSLIDRQVD